MVAYSFKRFFVPQIVVGMKRQTVRADRKRHARPGEPIQLYEGMRTSHCRKIIPDPVCVAVLPVVIGLSSLLDEFIAFVEIDGRPLHRDDIEIFARLDGFAPEHLNAVAIDAVGNTARANMGDFWRRHHGEGGRFEGVLIKW